MAETDSETDSETGTESDAATDSDPDTESGTGTGSDETDAVTVLPITDELDLHHFHPREVADLVTEYLLEAQALGLTRVRLIHGKGTGALRRTVHAALDRHPAVITYRLAEASAGSWGATLVELRSRT